MGQVYTCEFFDAIVAERARQEQKYGKSNIMNGYPQWATILGEEFGEVCRAIYEEDPTNLEEELIHVAAVAFSMYQRLQVNKAIMEDGLRGISEEQLPQDTKAISG